MADKEETKESNAGLARRDEWWPERRMFDLLDTPSWAGLREWPNFAALRDRMLRIEESFDNDTFVVRSEMPGIDPDKDVTVEIHNHLLEISAERREETTSEDDGTRRSEFRYGSFYRAVPVPADAKEDGVKASYKDGILEVRVPCAAPAEKKMRHRISIKRH